MKNTNNIIKSYKNLDIKEKIKQLCEIEPSVLSSDSLDCSYNFCKNIALKHYENFPVGSILIPRQARKHFYSIYAFSRFADDIADIPSIFSSEERIEFLSKYENLLELCQSEKTSNPIFLVLTNTIKNFNIPISTLKKLISAFKMDINFKQADSIKDLEHYCSFSANPVGELVLRLFNNYNDDTAIFSDSICTGLQLLNFWQDLSLDLKNGRSYIPKEYEEKYSITSKDFLKNNSNLKLNNCLNELLELTESYFIQGEQILKLINNKRLKLELKVIIEAALYFIKIMKKNPANLLIARPKISKTEKIIILIKALF